MDSSGDLKSYRNDYKMYFVVYCLCHPYHENSDAWIIDVYQDEATANDLVEKLKNSFNSYRKRRRDLLNNAYGTFHENNDGFEKYNNECCMNNDELENLQSIHKNALLRYCNYKDDILEYKYDVI